MSCFVSSLRTGFKSVFGCFFAVATSWPVQLGCFEELLNGFTLTIAEVHQNFRENMVKSLLLLSTVSAVSSCPQPPYKPGCMFVAFCDARLFEQIERMIPTYTRKV